MITLDLSESIAGLERLQRRLSSIRNIMDHAGPLMKSIERRIDAGNRAGVLAGLDKDGNPAPLLTYRPKNARPMTVNERLGQHPQAHKGKYQARAVTPVSGSRTTTT